MANRFVQMNMKAHTQSTSSLTLILTHTSHQNIYKTERAQALCFLFFFCFFFAKLYPLYIYMCCVYFFFFGCCFCAKTRLKSVSSDIANERAKRKSIRLCIVAKKKGKEIEMKIVICAGKSSRSKSKSGSDRKIL